jgi:hypothetical protein
MPKLPFPDRGYECCIIMPDDVAVEKVNILQTLGAEVVRVRPGKRAVDSIADGLPPLLIMFVITPASIVDEKQFVVSPSFTRLSSKE